MSLSPDLSWLPGIEYWGVRRIEQTIDASAAGGALVGFVGGSILTMPIPVLATLAAQHFGPLAGAVATVLGKLLAVYLALLALAHWQAIDSASDTHAQENP